MFRERELAWHMSSIINTPHHSVNRIRITRRAKIARQPIIIEGRVRSPDFPTLTIENHRFANHRSGSSKTHNLNDHSRHETLQPTPQSRRRVAKASTHHPHVVWRPSPQLPTKNGGLPIPSRRRHRHCSIDKSPLRKAWAGRSGRVKEGPGVGSRPVMAARTAVAVYHRW